MPGEQSYRTRIVNEAMNAARSGGLRFELAVGAAYLASFNSKVNWSIEVDELEPEEANRQAYEELREGLRLIPDLLRRSESQLREMARNLRRGVW